MGRIRRNWALVIGVLVLFGVPGLSQGCELPAEPVAAAVPDISDEDYQKNAKLVDGVPVPYFLVPQGTKLKMRVVWDPWDHNGAKMDGKYEWVERPDKGNIAADPKAAVVDGKKYFPLEAMQQFFKVTGNRGDLSEAIARQGTAIPNNTFVPETPTSGIGPAYMLQTGFAKPDGRLTVVGGAAPTHPDASVLCSPSGTDLPMSAVNACLPSLRTEFSPQEGDWQEFQNSGKTYRKKYKIAPTEGLYAGTVDFALDPPKKKDFKMYVVDEPSPGVWMDSSSGLKVLPLGSSDGTGNDAGEVEVRFDTPTLGADPIKIAVTAPGAGYKVKNLFWCWEEEPVVELGTDTSSPLDGVIDSWSSVPPATVNLRNLKCSVGIEVTVVKPAQGQGFTAVHVFDSKPPIASKFTMENAPVLECGKPIPSLPFKLVFCDSNPYGDKPVAAMKGKVDGKEVDVEYAKAKIKDNLKIFMSYPAYQFEWKDVTVPDFDDPKKIDCGFFKYLSPQAPEKWQGLLFKSKWVWREAAVTINEADIKPTQEKADGTTLWGGMKWEVTGTANFGIVAPTHFANDGPAVSADYTDYNYPAEGSPDTAKLLKVFAVVKDSAGQACTGYSDISVINKTAFMGAAGKALDAVGHPDSGAEWKTTYEQAPPLAAAITNGIGAAGNDYPWQSYVHPKIQDTSTPPEIQVIVFDTRNNRYHLYGAKTGGDAKANDTAIAAVDAYPELNPAPYSPADIGNLTSSLVFDAVDIANFDRFVDKDGTKGGADTQQEAGLAKAAFVCQQNTRLIFYIRAWDNINTFDVGTKKQGIKNIACTITDWAGDANELASVNTPRAYDAVEFMKKPLVWQFRGPNYDTAGTQLAGTGDCSLTVTATDEADKSQTLTIKFAILGNDLTIRSLEEKRNRQ